MNKSKRMEEVEKYSTDPKFDELGSTGLQRQGKITTLDEEFVRDLKGVRAARTYREMRDNDPVIGAMLFAIDMLIRNASWHVESEDEETKAFVESCMLDMSHTWDEFISEVLSMLTFGYSLHEIVYKKRLGENKDPTKNSKFTDGKIGWRKLPIRSQDSITEWVFDDNDELVGAVQQLPSSYKTVTLPAERLLLFRTRSQKDSPEGRSILRNVYRPWYFKKKIEEIEAIGVERDLTGIPVIYRSAEMAAQYDDELKRILRNIRRDEQEGLLLPLAYDENGHKMLEFSLLSAPGARQFDTSKVIDRYNQTIAMTSLADFILLGHESVGSFALSSSKTRLFSVAINSYLWSIAAVINRVAVPRLLSINGIRSDKSVTIEPGDIETPDLQELGQYISALAGAGAPLFPDPELEDHLRRIASLPVKSEKAI